MAHCRYPWPLSEPASKPSGVSQLCRDTEFFLKSIFNPVYPVLALTLPCTPHPHDTYHSRSHSWARGAGDEAAPLAQQWFCFIALRVLQEAVTTDDQWAECSRCNTSFFSRSGMLVVDFKFKMSRLFHIGLNLFGLEGWLVIWLSFRQAVRVTVMKLFFLIHYVRNAISDINNSWPSNYSVSSYGYQCWFSGSYFVVYWKRAAGGWNCGIVDLDKFIE